MTAARWLFAAIALVLVAAAVAIARDRAHPRRWSAAAFWGLLALLFVAADHVPAELTGAGLVLLALIAPRGGQRRATASAPAAPAQRNLFVPALAIPAATVAGVLLLQAWGIKPDSAPWLGGLQPTLLALALACALAFVLALRTTGARPAQAFDAGRGLLEAMGWAAMLPLALAMLGAVFAAAGVGELVGHGASRVVATESRVACVLAYGLSMAAFTMVMGNAFAAFPVITAGIGLPLLVTAHGADPAATAAIGMLCGYCGTLMTPMAANYNVVPAALLDLDQHAVVRAQFATAMPLLAANLILLGTLPFL